MPHLWGTVLTILAVVLFAWFWRYGDKIGYRDRREPEQGLGEVDSSSEEKHR